MCYLAAMFKRVIVERKKSFNQLVAIIFSLSETTLMKENKKGKIGFKDIICA